MKLLKPSKACSKITNLSQTLKTWLEEESDPLKLAVLATVNHQVSITLVLSEKKRKITFEGVAKPLSDQENTAYWNNYLKDSQVRFMVYGTQSGDLTAEPSQLDLQLKAMQKNQKRMSVTELYRQRLSSINSTLIQYQTPRQPSK